MDYQQHFEAVGKAIQSLRIFPDTIKEFTEMLRQGYQRNHSTRDLVWIDELCGIYHDNCYNYVEFIKRVIATQFLAQCLTTENDSERKRIINELKANLRAANKRLDRFLGPTERKEVVEKLDGVLTEMEEIKTKRDKKAQYFQKLSEWLRGKLLEQVSVVFAKIIGPLWDMIYTNATLALQSDYDHETLKCAVSNIGKNVPRIEESVEENRRALEGVNSVLKVLETEEEELLGKSLRYLYPMEIRVKNACDDIIKLLESLKS